MDSTVQQVWAFLHLWCHWCRFESAPVAPQSEQAELLDWDCFRLTDIFQKKQKEKQNQKPTLTKTVCWKRPDQLGTSPTTSLLLLCLQTWLYSSTNIIRTCSSQQCFRRAFCQHEQFYFLFHADSLHCGGMCLCSHLCLEITTAQEHQRIFPHTLGA